MTGLLNFLLLTALLLAPFAVVAALASRSHHDGALRRYLDRYRFDTQTVGRLFDDRDADFRRIDHDLDAVRTRFEDQPSWPSSGASGDRR